MRPRPLTRVIIAALGGLLGGVLMIGILAAVNGTSGFSACTATATLGWAVPLIAGAVIGGMSVLLLQSAEEPQPPERPTAKSSHCASCGSPILEEWRLCPHCGSLLECDIAVPGPSGAVDLV